jgi:membrane protein involved in colicin uptake
MLRLGEQGGKYVIVSPVGQIVAIYSTRERAIAHLNNALRQQRAAEAAAAEAERKRAAEAAEAAERERKRAAEAAADAGDYDLVGEMGLPDDDEMEGEGRYHGGDADMDAAFDDVQSKVAPVYTAFNSVIPGLGTAAKTFGDVALKPFASWVADPTGEVARENAAIAAKKAAADAEGARNRAADQAADAAVAAGDSYARERNLVGLPANAPVAETAHAMNRMMGLGSYNHRRYNSAPAYFDS